MIADFPWPVVQDGWLECDGSDINTTTYSALYDVMTIQTSGTRISGNPAITSISSTANMRVGYFVFGTGIASGTTILSVNSGSQITLSGNASSSGTSTIVVSPWLLNTGTIRLPNLTNNGLYRRARTASTAVGQFQQDAFKGHLHNVSGNTGTESANHIHAYSGTSGGMNANNPHNHPYVTPLLAGTAGGSNDFPRYGLTTVSTGATDINHAHDFSGVTGIESAAHAHNLSINSSFVGDTETRPITMIFMTCVKY